MVAFDHDAVGSILSPLDRVDLAVKRALDRPQGAKVRGAGHDSLMASADIAEGERHRIRPSNKIFISKYGYRGRDQTRDYTTSFENHQLNHS
jgi:hypothetical protein